MSTYIHTYIHSRSVCGQDHEDDGDDVGVVPVGEMDGVGWLLGNVEISRDCTRSMVVSP